MIAAMTNSGRFIALRDQLLRTREDWEAAHGEFRCPEFEEFNWVGRLRRVELRRLEERRAPAEGRRPQEFWEEDLRAQLAANPT